MPVFVGLSPRETLNVWINLVPGGALISVTWNFLRLVERYCHLVAAAHDALEVHANANHQAMVDKIREIGDVFISELDAILDGSELSSFPIMSERNVEFAKSLTGLVLEYALAHELGHLLSGHLGIGDYTRHPGRESPFLRNAKHLFSQSEEIDADYVGMLLVSHSVSRIDNHNVEIEIDDQTVERFFGAVLLFELMDIIAVRKIERSHPKLRRRQVFERARSTHPHPGWRRDRAIEAGLAGWGKTFDKGATVRGEVEPLLRPCDELAWRLWAMRGRAGASMYRNGEAEQALFELVDEPSRAWVTEMYLTTSKDLIVVLNYGALGEQMLSSFTAAAAAVAAAAAIYLTCVYAQCWVASHREQFALAHLFAIFEAIYLGEIANPDATRIAGLIRAAVPEIDGLTELLGPVGAFSRP